MQPDMPAAADPQGYLYVVLQSSAFDQLPPTQRFRPGKFDNAFTGTCGCARNAVDHITHINRLLETGGTKYDIQPAMRLFVQGKRGIVPFSQHHRNTQKEP